MLPLDQALAARRATQQRNLIMTNEGIDVVVLRLKA
jgi:hypothetical protein